MDFSTAEPDRELRTLASEILADFAAPERLKTLEADGAYFDQSLWAKLAETGILSASLPVNLGGMGMDYGATSLVTEAIGQAVVSIPYIPCIVSTALPLASAEVDPTVGRALQKIASGEALMVTGFIEPGNEDPLQPQMLVSLNEGAPGEDQYRIAGSKHCVPYAANAEAVLVSARRHDPEAGELLWLGLVPTAQETVSLNPQRCTANEPQYQLVLDGAVAHPIAEGEQAAAIIRQSIAMTTVAYCSMAVGVVDKMMRISAEYTSQREQFGVAIATFQAVAHRLASCYIDTECLRIITLKAAGDVSRGEFDSDAITMAKTWCGDVLHRVSHAAQHVHGGMGVDRDYPLFRYCLWAKQLELNMGCSKVHLEKLADRLAARYLPAQSP